MLTVQEVIDKLTPGDDASYIDMALEFLLPAVLAKYPDAKLCVCEAFMQHDDRDDVLWRSTCYKIDGNFFNEMGWITPSKMEAWTRYFNIENAEGGVQIRDREDVKVHADKSNERRAKRIFNQHHANFDAIALNVATRRVPTRPGRNRL